MTHKNAQQLLGEVGELLREIEVNSVQKAALFSSLNKVDREYESGKFGYLDYEERQKAVLRDRSREEWADYYKANAYSLLKKADFIVSQVIAIVHDDTSYDGLKVGKAAAAISRPEEAKPLQSQLRVRQHLEVFNIDNEIDRLKKMLSRTTTAQLAAQPAGDKRRVKAGLKIALPKFADLASEVEAAEKKALKMPHPKPRPVPFAAGGKSNFLMSVASFAKSAAKLIVDIPLTAARSLRTAFNKVTRKQPATPSTAKKPEATGRQSVISALGQLACPKKSGKDSIFVEEIVAMEKQAKTTETSPTLKQKEPVGLAFGWFSGKSLLREFTDKFRQKQGSVVADKTAVPVQMKKLSEMRKKLYEEERLSGFDSTLLAQEARRVKKILEVEKPAVYQGSSLGLIANLTVRKISLFLVDTFPEFFGFLYNALRAANVKVLSNTYVNIMILSSLMVSFFSFILLTVIFFIFGHPIYQIFLRAGLLSIISGFATATVFYVYPLMKIKERRRNIMTNMPFGINHMAAVATSGVPPAAMFELISASNEYGEIGVELKKVVDFISIFGFDFLTAIKTVAATTPSRPFKDFLEGVVSTIETGGDLDQYLRQEADQAALTYNLERQRYNETVSTYSDIYTGLLIAAPLFFVAAMSLVNLLGGSLGGIGVDVVMAVGAYAVIPILNIGFLAFLQISQPEV